MSCLSFCQHSFHFKPMSFCFCCFNSIDLCYFMDWLTDWVNVCIDLSPSYEGSVHIFQMLKMKHLMVPLEETKVDFCLWMNMILRHIHARKYSTHTAQNDNNDDYKVRWLTNNRNLSVFLCDIFSSWWNTLSIHCIELHTFCNGISNVSYFLRKREPKWTCQLLQTDWEFP